MQHTQQARILHHHGGLRSLLARHWQRPAYRRYQSSRRLPCKETWLLVLCRLACHEVDLLHRLNKTFGSSMAGGLPPNPSLEYKNLLLRFLLPQIFMRMSVLTFCSRGMQLLLTDQFCQELLQENLQRSWEDWSRTCGFPSVPKSSRILQEHMHSDSKGRHTIHP